MGLRFSANLGFLWNELALPEAVHAAAAAGFDAVELHWPYAVDPAALSQALAQTGLPVLALNTPRGDVAAGEFGLAALPGREEEAREGIEQAMAYARAIGAGAVHVLAGLAEGQAAQETFIANLRYAADKGAQADIAILIEPLNVHDVPGYFLSDNARAAAVIEAVGHDNVRLLFDCYHLGRAGRSIMDEFETYRALIGHIQFAGVPARNEPDEGEIDFASLLPQLAAEGYSGYFGAEYRPSRSTAEGSGWLAAWRREA